MLARGAIYRSWESLVKIKLQAGHYTRLTRLKALREKERERERETGDRLNSKISRFARGRDRKAPTVEELLPLPRPDATLHRVHIYFVSPYARCVTRNLPHEFPGLMSINFTRVPLWQSTAENRWQHPNDATRRDATRCDVAVWDVIRDKFGAVSTYRSRNK